MITNESKCLFPTNIDSPIEIQEYLYLSDDRGCILFKMGKYFYASVVSLDLNDNTYKIGKYHYIRYEDEEDEEYTPLSLSCKLVRLSNNLISAVVLGDMMEYTVIYLFEVNKELSDCELQERIDVPEYAQYLTMMDGKLVYAKFNTIDQDYNRSCLNAMVIRDKDGTLTELENTGIYLEKLEYREFTVKVSI
jgi:hypothetical protein